MSQSMTHYSIILPLSETSVPRAYLSSGFTTCTRLFGLPEPPGLPRWCSMPYTSDLPSLTVPLTVVEIFYEPYNYTLDSSKLLWGNRVGYRTTRVISKEWSVFLPATSTVRAVSASHIVIRWREADFIDVPTVTEDTTTLPTTGRFTPSVSVSPSCTNSADCPGAIDPGPFSHPGISKTTVVALVLGLVLFGIIVFRFIRKCRARRKGWRDFQGLELDDGGPNIGCLVLHNQANIDSEIMAE